MILILMCRYYYNIYNTSSVYPLVSNVNYGFKVPKDEQFKFEFNVEGETNPAYYILLNKLGSGDLKINLNNNEEITITDSNPYRGIYVNRDNLFNEYTNQDSYNCKLIRLYFICFNNYLNFKY